MALAMSMEQSRGGAPDSLPPSPVAPRGAAAAGDAAGLSYASHVFGAEAAAGSRDGQAAGATAAPAPSPPEDGGKACAAGLRSN